MCTDTPSAFPVATGRRWLRTNGHSPSWKTARRSSSALTTTRRSTVAQDLASRLRINRAAASVIGLLALAATAGLFYPSRPLVIAAQVVTMTGITILTVVLTRYLHDLTPSTVRTGASSVVGAAGYGLFVPVALAFGMTSERHGIFQASWFLTGALLGASLALVAIALRAGGRTRVSRPAIESSAQDTIL